MEFPQINYTKGSTQPDGKGFAELKHMSPGIPSRKTFSGLAPVLLFYILNVTIFATVSGVTKGSPAASYISLAVSSLLTFLLIVVFTRWQTLQLADVGIDLQLLSVKRFLCGFGMGIVMVTIQAIITGSFAQVTFMPSSNLSGLATVSSLILYFLVALREELVFRSYALRSLAKSTTPLIALATITIIFILEHVIAGVPLKISVIGSGLGGVLFGLAALKTKGLALPLGIHTSWNFTQWMLGFKDDSGIWKEVVEPGREAPAENVALLGFTVAFGIAIICILIVYRNERMADTAKKDSAHLP